MGLKVKLVKSRAGSSARQDATIEGLGLTILGSERLLKNTPEIRGMLNKVRHLVEMQIVADEPVVRQRRKPKSIRVRDAARARAVESSKS
jgi:large subunit ribosomal protein L30